MKLSFYRRGIYIFHEVGGVRPSLSLLHSHHNKKIVNSNHSRTRGFQRDNGWPLNSLDISPLFIANGFLNLYPSD